MTEMMQARHIIPGDRIYLAGVDRFVTATKPGDGVTVTITTGIPPFDAVWQFHASRLVTVTTPAPRPRSPR